jgi:hypothetical protein
MNGETSQPLLNGKTDEESGALKESTYALWRSDLWDVCLLSGPACLQLLFQVRMSDSPIRALPSLTIIGNKS